MAERPTRDPRRSLIIGTVIAGVVLALLLLVVMVGVYIVFSPRSSDRDSLGRPPAAVAASI